MEAFKTKLTSIFNTCISFVRGHGRYFVGAIIFVCIMLILFSCTSADTSSEDPTAGVYEAYSESVDDEIVTLINNYYTAYASGDTDTIQSLATPVCAQEISYIQFYSQYIDSFSDIQLFTKKGLTDDSYLVSAVVNLKFVDIDTLAPGCDFFYVEKNEDGAYYINNTYGSFNQTNSVYQMDTDISNLIAVFNQQEDVLVKEATVQEAFDKALASDSALSDFIGTTLTNAIVQWNSDYQAQVAADEAAAAEAQAEEEAQAEADAQAAASAEQEAAEEANAYTGTVNSRANVRESADASSNKLGALDQGSQVTIYGEEGDFYKIDYEGSRAYITKEAVTSGDSTDTADTEDNTSTSASALEKGTEITLDSTVNIRSSMDSSSSKVAVAYAGEKVTVVMSYAEGWTKVKYGKKEGYIRTDLLQ